MSNLRRYFQKGDIVFITNVTFNRNNILIDNIDLLTSSIKKVKDNSDFDIIAFVYMPDHFHLLIDSKNKDITKIMQRIKMSFGNKYRIRNNVRSGRVWQNRYWDHIIKDQEDLNHHIDYIHYNPVKHGKVNSPFDWKHSSIHEFKHIYSQEWGCKKIDFKGDFGE